MTQVRYRMLHKNQHTEEVETAFRLAGSQIIAYTRVLMSGDTPTISGQKGYSGVVNPDAVRGSEQGGRDTGKTVGLERVSSSGGVGEGEAGNTDAGKHGRRAEESSKGSAMGTSQCC
ncbi:unnamed protein product [Discosporangium mesarthrocarpum]